MKADDLNLKNYRLEDVFVPVGLPQNTYVIRAELEKDLQLAMLNKGKHILIKGQSKSGKSNLWRKHLNKDIIKIPLNSTKTLDDVYTEIFNALETFYVSEQNEELGLSVSFLAEFSAKIQMLFSMRAQASLGSTYKGTDKSVPIAKQLIGANLVIKYLAPAKKRVVLEDFHYSNEQLKILLAQDLKAFSDEGCQFVVISVLQNSDLGSYNRDLQQRFSNIPVGLFSRDELEEIIRTGERLLNITFAPGVRDKIIFESMDSAALTQDICQKICFELNVLETKKESLFIINDLNVVYNACKKIALENKGLYDDIVSIVPKGGRSDGSTEKYKWFLKMIQQTDIPESGLLNTEVLQRLRNLGHGNIAQSSVTAGLKYLPRLLRKRKLAPVFAYTNDRFFLLDKYMKFVFKWVPELIDDLFIV